MIMVLEDSDIVEKWGDNRVITHSDKVFILCENVGMMLTRYDADDNHILFQPIVMDSGNWFAQTMPISSEYLYQMGNAWDYTLKWLQTFAKHSLENGWEFTS